MCGGGGHSCSEIAQRITTRKFRGPVRFIGNLAAPGAPFTHNSIEEESAKGGLMKTRWQALRWSGGFVLAISLALSGVARVDGTITATTTATTCATGITIMIATTICHRDWLSEISCLPGLSVS